MVDVAASAIGFAYIGVAPAAYQFVKKSPPLASSPNKITWS